MEETKTDLRLLRDQCHARSQRIQIELGYVLVIVVHVAFDRDAA